MIVYFANRFMTILGLASTDTKHGFTITDDWKTVDVDSGVTTFEFDLGYTPDEQLAVKEAACAGNYLLRYDDDDYEFYTIIETENDSKTNTMSIFAEDAGLDLLNEIVGEFTADTAHPIAWYINKFAAGSGFEIRNNEIANLTRTLSWDGDATAAERIRSVATQFDNAEIGYAFEIEGLKVTHKYIDIYKKRGKNIGMELRLGKEVGRIVERKSVADLATALLVKGGTKEGESNPVTLIGYTYDDGDFYVDKKTGILYCRSALEKWSRFLSDSGTGDGNIIAKYESEAITQKTLCSNAISHLKIQSEIAVNYDVELLYLPENLRIGDTVSIIDDAGEVYLTARLLQLRKSVSNNIYDGVFGEFLIKSSGISERLTELSQEFQKIADVRTLYTWVAYADDSEGTGISLDPEGKSWLGMAANRLSATVDISDPSIFNWSEIGNAGNGMTLTITSSNGAVFIETKVETVLTAHLFLNGGELSAAEIATFGTVKWYLIENGAETYLGSGLTYTVSNLIAANIVAKLEG